MRDIKNYAGAKLKFWVRGSLADFGGDRDKKNSKSSFFSCGTIKSDISCYPVIVNCLFAKTVLCGKSKCKE